VAPKHRFNLLNIFGIVGQRLQMPVDPGFQLAPGCHKVWIGTGQAEENIPLSGRQSNLLIV
jgi:hypothetical protein